jgi:RND superfamily putative drug exporter
LIARLATGRPRYVVAVWVGVVAILAVLGIGIERKLTIHPTYVPGTESARAHEISEREFGTDNVLIVMLRGPRDQIERQGSILAARLGGLPGMEVVSPWARGATIAGLQPSPNVAALMLRSDSDEAGDFSAPLAEIRRQMRGSVRAPVRANLAGFPVTFEVIHTASEEAARVGERIALPVLLLVLLLVFRSVLAALVPVVVGATVVAATRGVLDLLLGLVELDLFAVGVVGMMGLALGVDYSLLVVSRFREEQLRARGDTAAAVAATVRNSVRSIVPAGSALILAMAAAVLIVPGTIVRSMAIAITTVTVLSMLSAICVVPALLSLLGDRLDRWSLPRRSSPRVGLLAWTRRIADHPRAVVLIMTGMLFLAVWSVTLKTGVGGIDLIPSGNTARIQQEEVAKELGPGWLAPMEIVVHGRGRPVTSPDRLRALAAFQRQVERDPGVQTMAGLSQLDSGAEQLSGIEGDLASQERGLDRLQTGISRARLGAAQATGGLLKAAAGASHLDSGLGSAEDGAGALSEALRLTSTGSTRLSRGLGRAAEGSRELAQGAGEASDGADRLAAALGKAQEQTGQIQDSAQLIEKAMKAGNERLDGLDDPLRVTEERLATAWQALQRMTVGQGDSEYAAVVRAIEDADRSLTGNDIRTGEQVDPSYEGLGDGIERAAGQFDVGSYLAERLGRGGIDKGMAKIAQGSARLGRGLDRLADASMRLSAGVAALDRGGAELAPALQRVSRGAEYLTGGLGRIATGAGEFAVGLSKGAEKSKLLSGGLGRIETGLERQQAPGAGGSRIAQLRRQSPGLFQSSYFVLAGFDGSPPKKRRQIAFLVNLDNGGTDARMLVIPAHESTSAGAKQTKERLQQNAAALGRRTGTEVLVGGVTPFVIDLDQALRDQIPLLRLVLSLVSMLVLIPVMRSLTMPAIAALLNAITVSACFGLLALLFNGSLLGGPGYVETSILLAAMVVMFGLAIDYEVFVFARMREEYVRTGSTDAAIRGGLDRTAHVITGAAIIMITVFLAFSVSKFASFRDFGVAQAFGVFIDAFLVRLIVIPAIMRWLGKASWWMPRWLDRLLPGPRSGAHPG